MQQSPLKQAGPRREKYGDFGQFDDGEVLARRPPRASLPRLLRRTPREEFAFEVRREKRRQAP